MSVSLNKTADKLRLALNSRGYNLTLSQKQIMSKEKRLVNLYIVSQAVWNEEREKYYNEELYTTSSRLRMVFYLRDLWYMENGWDFPLDDERWNATREELIANGQYRTRNLQQES